MSGARGSPDPVELACRALRTRDHSAASLDARLERRGIGAEDRAAAVARVVELGYVDDARFALGRALTLAERGAGNLLVADDLERHGIAAELVTEAIAALEPELDRARVIVARRGATAKTARLLAARGFGSDTVEGVIAAAAGDALG
jgi:SOS response regulatory protein OraA/RecX